MESLTYLMLLLAIFQMTYCVFVARQLSFNTKIIDFQKRWKLVEILIIFFLISYIGFAIYIHNTDFSIIFSWIAMVYFFGASFVILMLVLAQKSLFALQEKQKIFVDGIFSSLTHPFFVVSVDDELVVYSNSAARSSMSQDDKKTFHDINKIYCDENNPCLLTEVKKYKEPISVSYVYKNNNDEDKHFQINTYPIIENGDVKEIIFSIIDLSKQLEGERMRTVNSMIATYNHEINNPLVIAMANLEFGMQNISDDKLQEKLKKVQKSLEQVRDIVKTIDDLNADKISFKDYITDTEMVHLKKK